MLLNICNASLIKYVIFILVDCASSFTLCDYLDVFWCLHCNGNMLRPIQNDFAIFAVYITGSFKLSIFMYNMSKMIWENSYYVESGDEDLIILSNYFVKSPIFAVNNCLDDGLG